MKTLKGPAIFLAQFAGDAPPFNSLSAIANWAREAGFIGIQIPSWDGRLFDLKRAAESDARRQAPATVEKSMSLGTGHGRSETSRVTHTQFERATQHPEEVIAIRYDTHANLVAMGGKGIDGAHPLRCDTWRLCELKPAAKGSERLVLF